MQSIPCFKIKRARVWPKPGRPNGFVVAWSSPVASPSAVARCRTVSSLTGQSGSSALMFCRPPSSLSSCKDQEDGYPFNIELNNPRMITAHWSYDHLMDGWPRLIVLPQLVPVSQGITHATQQHGYLVVLQSCSFSVTETWRLLALLTNMRLSLLTTWVINLQWNQGGNQVINL